MNNSIFWKNKWKKHLNYRTIQKILVVTFIRPVLIIGTYEYIRKRWSLTHILCVNKFRSVFTFVSPDNNSAILGTTCNYWSVRSNRWRPCHIPNPIGMAFKFAIGLSNPISRFILTPNFDHIVTSAGNQPFFADFRTPTHRVAPNVMSGWDFFNFPIILFGNVFQYGNWTIRRSTSQN